MAAVVVFASVLVPVGPAHAYNPNPEGRYFSQWAHDCSKHTVFPTGGDEFFKWGGGDECFIKGASVHQVTYRDDAGGRNLYFDLVLGTQVVGIVSFEARDEILKLRDLKSDGDTFYVWISGLDEPFRPPPSADGWGTFDRSFTDGHLLNIWITDDRAGNDVIVGSAILP
jgi:hypothetical protein